MADWKKARLGAVTRVKTDTGWEYRREIIVPVSSEAENPIEEVRDAFGALLTAEKNRRTEARKKRSRKPSKA